MGGEHSQYCASAHTPAGSSPRGRGTLDCGGRSHSGRRFIPAWAGNTTDPSPGLPACAVHPRVGGEHRSAHRRPLSSSGSSPRGRGTLHGPILRAVPQRFIPAWAGNTPTVWRSTSDSPVHPRVGGEHPVFDHMTAITSGSSPRGRGTRAIQCSLSGSCTSPGAQRSRTTVHPRVGGEHSVDVGFRRQVGGSSPRGRGTHDPGPLERIRQRFIPAWAGNTRSRPRYAESRPVHPRVGGEHRISSPFDWPQAGSSPRGRGTLSMR